MPKYDVEIHELNVFTIATVAPDAEAARRLATGMILDEGVRKDERYKVDVKDATLVEDEERKDVDNPDTGDMVKAFLDRGGYDGLYNLDDRCSCSLDDFIPCGRIESDCVAGYYQVGCTNGCGEGCDFHIVPDDPKAYEDDEEGDAHEQPTTT